MLFRSAEKLKKMGVKVVDNVDKKSFAAIADPYLDKLAKEPAKAFELEKTAAIKLKALGVTVVEDVDKKSFTTIADPYLDKLAKELGPHAEKIKNLIRAIN